MAKKIKVKVHSDPGHGWIAVKKKDVLELGIENEISTYSFMKGKTVYLEEDADATLFINRAKSKGWKVELVEATPRDNQHPIRNYGRYNSSFINGVEIGECVYQQRDDDFKAFKVLSDESVLDIQTDQKFRVPNGDFSKYFISSKDVDKIKEKRRKENDLLNFAYKAGLSDSDIHYYESIGLKVPGGILDLIDGEYTIRPGSMLEDVEIINYGVNSGLLYNLKYAHNNQINKDSKTYKELSKMHDFYSE